MDKKILDNMTLMTEEDYTLIKRLIENYYKDTSIAFADTLKDIYSEGKSEGWDKVMRIFNNDYVALGLFVEEHKSETYTASGNAHISCEFSDVEIEDPDNAHEEVSAQIYGADLSLHSGYSSGDVDDFSIEDVNKQYSLDPFAKIQKDYKSDK